MAAAAPPTTTSTAPSPTAMSSTTSAREEAPLLPARTEESAFDRLFTKAPSKTFPWHAHPRHLRIGSQNILTKLRLRERLCHRPNAAHANTKKMYLNIYPKKTHYQVEEELLMVNIKNFSPCGQYLVAFSRASGVHSLQVYRFRLGLQGHRLHGVDEVCEPEEQEAGAGARSVWSRYFVKHFSTVLSQGADSLCNQFCLFTPGSRFVVVASSQPAQQPPFSVHHPHPPDALKTFVNPEDITLYVVDLKFGNVTAKQSFQSDYVSLTYNNGVSMDGNRMAVLLMVRQQVQLFTIRNDGSLLHLTTIGEACHPDDALFRARTAPWATAARPADMAPPTSLSAILEAGPPQEEERPAEPFIGGLKHRLLVAIYRRAKSSKNTSELMRFFDRFEEFQSLAMLRMQLLDDHHLLIKYGNPDIASTRTPDIGCFALMIVYNYVTTDVVALFNQNDERLLELYENLTDYFRPGAPVTPSPMNSLHTRGHFRRTLQCIRAARHGGLDQALRRGLSSLPMSSQTIRESPYFDLDLFGYDEKLISHSDRHKACGDFPVKFFSRIHGGMLFAVPTGLRLPVRTSRTKRAAWFIFHPSLPFAITVQQTTHPSTLVVLNTTINIHFRS